MSWLILALISHAQAQEVEGFAEVRAQVYTGVEADLPVFFVERVRPSFTAPLSDRVVLSTTIEAGMGQGYTPQEGLADIAEDAGVSGAVVGELRGVPPTNELLGVSHAHNYLSVDRLTLQVQHELADVVVGRQALNWGSGFAVNPSDPFPEVLLTEPWKPRSGMNAIRVDVPFGELNAAQLVVGSDDAFTHPRVAGRVTVNWLETDWSLVGAWREEIDEGIVGIDIKGTLGVGFWFEGVAHIGADQQVYEEFAVGIDYSLPILESFMLTAQYYRNGADAASSGVGALFEQPKPFAPAFGSTNYLMASVGAGIIPELSVSALWLQNLDDGTAFVVPAVSFASAGGFDLSLAAQVPLDLTGNGGEFKPAAADLILALPTDDGGLVPVDLGSAVPAATLIVWSRFNF